MMARLIGIIGSTHGVRFSASPPRRTSSRIASGPRPSKSPRCLDAVFRVADMNVRKSSRSQIAAEVRPAEDVEFVECGVDAGRLAASRDLRGSRGPPGFDGDRPARAAGRFAPSERDAVEDIRALWRAHGACGNNPQLPLGDRSLGREAGGVVAGLIAQARRHDDLAARRRKRERRTARRSRRRARRPRAAGRRPPA